MSYQITTEPKENRQLSVAITVDQQRVDNELRKAARKAAREYRIPGFRKGKAPYNIIVQYLGMEALYQEFLDDLGQEFYMKALEDGEFEPYAQASLDDISFEPLTYSLTVPLEPIVELSDYRAIRVEKAPVEVDEEQITERLEAYREQYAGWEDTDRPSEYGDMMNIDVRSVIAPEIEGEEETIVLDETDWDVTPSSEDPMEPAGFDEALLGMTPGEEKAFDISWPEDSQSINAGKTATFSVKLNNNQSYEKPPLDDDLAQLVGPDFETLDDLMANVRETLQEQAQAQADNDYMEAVFEAALEKAELEYPPAVIEDQIDSMVNELAQRLRQFGVEDVEDYMQQTGQTMEAYREGVREGATAIAERNLIISEIWKAEQIEVTDDDIEEKISEIVGEPDEIEALEELEDELSDEIDEMVEEIEEEVDEALEEVVEANLDDDEDVEELVEILDELDEDLEELEELEEELEDADAELRSREAMAEIFRSGGGRSMLEAQILQEKSVERLLAIARGDELPELAEIVEDEEATDDSADENDGEVEAVSDASDEEPATTTDDSESEADED